MNDVFQCILIATSQLFMLVQWGRVKNVFNNMYSFFRRVGNGTVDSDGCPVRRRFVKKETIPNLTRWRLHSFTINCTTQTVYKVGYSNGGLCLCGEYSVNKTGSQIRKFCKSLSVRPANFTVEISVENIRNPEGERCTFQFTYYISSISTSHFDVRILPKNVTTSVQPMPTTHKFLLSSTTHESPTGKSISVNFSLSPADGGTKKQVYLPY